MVGLDALSAEAGGVDPGGASQKAEAAGQAAAGAGQEGQGGRFEDLALKADGHQALLEILGDLGGGPGQEE